MKYKVGDTVRVKSKAWFDTRVFGSYGEGMIKFFGATMTIEAIVGDFYKLKNCSYLFKPLELEFVITKHTIQRRKFSPVGPIIY